MSNKEETLIIKKVKVSSVLDVTYLDYNGTIEDYEERGLKGKEAAHPDLQESLNILAQQIMQELGFNHFDKVDNWDEFKIKDVAFDGLSVKATIIFTNTKEGKVEVKCPATNSVTPEVVEGVIEEVKQYITGQKKQQGDLFANADNEEQEQPEESDETESEAVPA